MLVIGTAAAACQPPPAPCRMVAPLENEGALLVYVDSLPADGPHLVVTLESVIAIGADGRETFLEMERRELRQSSLHRARLLASGRLPPGHYTGLVLKTQRAQIEGSGGPADLLVSPEPFRLDLPFDVERGRAVTASISLQAARSVAGGFAFAPVLSGGLPPRTLPELSAYCSTAGTHSVTVVDRASLRVTGVMPTGRAPAGLALDPAGVYLYVGVAEDDAVEQIDVRSGEVLERIHLRQGDRPGQLAMSPDGSILLAVNAGSDTVTFVDPRAAAVLDQVPVGREPRDILLDRAGRRAYVLSSRSSDITVVDLANRAVVTTLPLEGPPLAAQMTRDGRRLLVLIEGSTHMLVYSLPDLAPLPRVYVGLDATSLKVDPATDSVYLAADGGERLEVYEPMGFARIDSIDLPAPVTRMAIDDPDNLLLLVLPRHGSVGVLDLGSRRLITEVEVGCDPRFVVLTKERR